MKKLLLLLFTVVMVVQVNAFTVKYYPKDVTHSQGVVAVLNDNYAPNQPWVMILHGIGERGDGGLKDLTRLKNWGPFRTNAATDPTMDNAADLYGFNILFIQTTNEFEKGEIQYGINFILNEFKGDSKRIYAVCNSLGGFGMAREVGKSATTIRPFAAVVMVVMGPGSIDATAKNWAQEKVPTWVITTSEDVNNGTHPKYSRYLHDEVAKLGGPIWITELKKGSHGQIGPIINAWYKEKGTIGGWTYTNCVAAVGDACGASNSMYTWMLNQVKGQTAKSPNNKLPVPTPEDIKQTVPPIVEPIKPKVIETIQLYDDGTWKKIAS